MNNLAKAYVTEVCKIGRGHDCCRYLVSGPTGFECAKLTPMRKHLNSRGDSMTARADNCEGVQHDWASKPEEVPTHVD